MCLTAQSDVTRPASDALGVAGCKTLWSLSPGHKPVNIQLSCNKVHNDWTYLSGSTSQGIWHTHSMHTHKQNPLVFGFAKGGGKKCSPNSCPATSRLHQPTTLSVCVSVWTPHPVIFLPPSCPSGVSGETCCVRDESTNIGMAFIVCSRFIFRKKVHSKTSTTCYEDVHPGWMCLLVFYLFSEGFDWTLALPGTHPTCFQHSA